MTAGRNDRRPVKIRRRGRHTSPSQVEKVAAQAGKAAPAVAIAGAIVTAPQAAGALAAPASTAAVPAHAHQARQGQPSGRQGTPAGRATLDAVTARAVHVTRTSAARHAALTSSMHYTVRSGDTLSRIAARYYHRAADWRYLYHKNSKTVSDPNLIYVGESLFIPATVPAGYVPRHAKATTTAHTVTRSTAASDGDGDNDGDGAGAAGTRSAGTGSSRRGSAGSGSSGTGATHAGMYSCGGLEHLWNSAGGNPADAVTAASIAMAESGGNPNAISPTSDYGLWQINTSNGSLATLNPYSNARSAITLSRNGTNWYPWTTYTSGAYAGRC